MPLTVAVDFDGVIHPYTRGWQGPVPDDEPPTPGCLEFLQWCRETGLRTVVFSTSATDDEGADAIWAWLERHRLFDWVDEVTHVKPPAIAYIDDRAVPFAGDWRTAMAAVDRLAGERRSWDRLNATDRLKEVVDAAQRRYHSDPVFHAQVEVIAQLTARYSSVTFDDGDWSVAKLAASLALVGELPTHADSEPSALERLAAGVALPNVDPETLGLL